MYLGDKKGSGKHQFLQEWNEIRDTYAYIMMCGFFVVVFGTVITIMTMLLDIQDDRVYYI